MPKRKNQGDTRDRQLNRELLPVDAKAVTHFNAENKENSASHKAAFEVEPYRDLARCVLAIFQKYFICSILADP